MKTHVEPKAELPVLQELAERFGPAAELEYVGDCWGSDLSTITPAEVITIHRDLGWTDTRYRVPTVPSVAALVDANGNPILKHKLEAWAMPSDGQYEFVLGDASGYGDCILDGETGEFVSGGIDHAPTDAEFEAIAAAIDALTDDEFLRLCLNARPVEEQ